MFTSQCFVLCICASLPSTATHAAEKDDPVFAQDPKGGERVMELLLDFSSAAQRGVDDPRLSQHLTRLRMRQDPLPEYLRSLIKRSMLESRRSTGARPEAIEAWLAGHGPTHMEAFENAHTYWVSRQAGAVREACYTRTGERVQMREWLLELGAEALHATDETGTERCQVQAWDPSGTVIPDEIGTSSEFAGFVARFCLWALANGCDFELAADGSQLSLRWTPAWGENWQPPHVPMPTAYPLIGGGIRVTMQRVVIDERPGFDCDVCFEDALGMVLAEKKVWGVGCGAPLRGIFERQFYPGTRAIIRESLAELVELPKPLCSSWEAEHPLLGTPVIDYRLADGPTRYRRGATLPSLEVLRALREHAAEQEVEQGVEQEVEQEDDGE